MKNKHYNEKQVIIDLEELNEIVEKSNQKDDRIKELQKMLDLSKEEHQKDKLVLVKEVYTNEYIHHFNLMDCVTNIIEAMNVVTDFKKFKLDLNRYLRYNLKDYDDYSAYHLINSRVIQKNTTENSHFEHLEETEMLKLLVESTKLQCKNECDKLIKESKRAFDYDVDSLRGDLYIKEEEYKRLQTQIQEYNKKSFWYRCFNKLDVGNHE